MNIKKEGKKLIIEVELVPKDQAQLSSTGKSKVAYSSRGFVNQDDIAVSLNIIYRKE